MKEIILNYEQAVIMVGECSGKIARIKDKLVKDAGFTSVETEGRGKKTIFKCFVEVENIDNSEIYYKQFKQRLINEYGFTNRSDFKSLFKVLEFHLLNKEEKKAMSLEDLAKEIGISKTKLERFRRNLKEVLTNRETSEKVLFGLHEGEVVYRKIDDNLLNQVIYKVYANEIKKIEKMFPNPHINDEVAIFIAEDGRDFQLIVRSADFERTKKDLLKSGCYYQSSYAVSFGRKVIRNEQGRRVINDALKRKIFDLICRVNKIEDTVDRYIYTLTDEIMNDDEFMNELVNALNHEEINNSKPKLRVV